MSPITAPSTLRYLLGVLLLLCLLLLSLLAFSWVSLEQLESTAAASSRLAWLLPLSLGTAWLLMCCLVVSIPIRERFFRHLTQTISERTQLLHEANARLNFLLMASRQLTPLVDLTQSRQLIVQLTEALAELLPEYQVQISLPIVFGNQVISKPHPFVSNKEFKPARQPSHEFAIACNQSNFGHLTVCKICHDTSDQHRALPAHYVELYQALCDIIATSLFYQQNQHRRQRLALMEERAAMARELHDSLAQSLSYLKIQVSRMRRKINSDSQGEQTGLPRAAGAPISDDVLQISADLHEGLTSAYRQLRELITTFRLTLKEHSLAEAVTSMLEELQLQEPMIGLTLQVYGDTSDLSPSEDIHVLQIIREAVRNAQQHAGAKKIIVVCNQEQRLMVQISDDGCGIGQAPLRRNHHGLQIMRERAATLNGELTINPGEKAGTVVTLSFVPQAKSQQANALNEQSSDGEMAQQITATRQSRAS